LSQNFLERRIDGLKLFNDACRVCLGVLKWQPSVLADSASQIRVHERKLKMVENVVQKITRGGRVLAEIFSKQRTHAQLVSRSEQVLRLLMMSGALSEEDRELIWDASEINDGDLKIELHKVLIGAAADMKGRDREFFVEHVGRLQPSNIIDRHIELVTEICTTIR
jgi:hypothetical protein